MSNLFEGEIKDWVSWGSVYQSINLFEPLIKYIFKKEGLAFSKIENCTPGTNAIFKVNDYIIKLFAPSESGIETYKDFTTEAFGIKWASNLDIGSPKLISSGKIEDRYVFYYMIMEYIEGEEFTNYIKTLSDSDKILCGQKLRQITDIMDIPCEPFNDVDILEMSLKNKRWNTFSDSFNRERSSYLKSLNLDNKVFVHGDLCSDNILVCKNKDLVIIDFADSVLAPYIYEQAVIICELFKFDKSFMTGYLVDYNKAEIVDLCLNGLLIHDFGSNIINDNLGNIKEIKSINDLKKQLAQKLI